MLSNALVNSGYDSVSMTSSYYYDEDNNYNIRMSQKDIDTINNKTGLNFRGIYEIEDKDSIKNEEIGIQQLYTRFSTYYYHKGLTGFIEFKQDEIDETSQDTTIVGVGTFNYKLIYGTYPKLGEDGVYQVAITKYYAEVLAELLGSGSFDFKINGEQVLKMEDLVGKYINVNGRPTPRFYITGIVDCGRIPSKYDVLKDAETLKNLETLKNDFDTYLNSTPNLCMFVGEGFVKKYMGREGTKRTSLYYSEDGKITINDNVPLVKYFLGTDGLSKSNTVAIGEKELFDSEGNCLLNEGETIVNISEIKTSLYFYNEFIKISQANKTEATQAISIATKSGYTILQRQTAIDDLFEIFKTDPNTKDLDIVKTLTVSKEIQHRKTTKTVTLTVVGFYYDLNPDITPGLEPIVLHSSDMQKLDIYENQGYFARIITPVGSKSEIESVVNYMTTTSGVRLVWFGNEIIKSIDAYEVQVQQFFDIFLYASLVLALFSIFMLFNYISTSIASKRQTIGILRALGSGGKDIFIMFAVESLIIAIINGIFASILTGVGSVLVNGYIRGTMNISLDFSYFSFRQIGLIFIFSIVTAIVSSIIPIVRISKEKPVDLIRKD